MSAENSYKIEPSVMIWPFFQSLPFIDRVKKIAEAGFKTVELSVECKSWTEAEAISYGQQLQQLGIGVDAVTTDYLGSGRPEFSCVDVGDRQNLMQNIRHRVSIMKAVGASHLIMSAGENVPGLSRETQYENLKEALMLALEIVESDGFTILLEPVNNEDNPTTFLWSISEGFKLIEEIANPRLKLLYDMYHAQISNGNLIRHLADNIDKVGLIHIADVPGRHEPGTGEINFANIYRMLASLKYQGCVGMEFVPTGDPMERLKAAREMLMNTVAAVSA